VLGLERLRKVRSVEPLAWYMHVEAGVPTATLGRLARENGLFFPPDPGAAEQSQIGGNIATNAGGPHAFKYGVTGEWVLGVEAVVPPGELVTFGGPVRKDAAGYDLATLLIGSEGTLGVITAAWLRLVPAPEATLSVAAFYPEAERGCEAIEEIVGSRSDLPVRVADGARLGQKLELAARVDRGLALLAGAQELLAARVETAVKRGDEGHRPWAQDRREL